MNCMQNIKKWYWGQSQDQKSITVPTCTIVHPCLDIMEVTDTKQIPKGVCNINQSRKALQRNPIHITESDFDFILYIIKRRDTSKYEIYITVDDHDKYFTCAH